jgi:hypothetical protein
MNILPDNLVPAGQLLWPLVVLVFVALALPSLCLAQEVKLPAVNLGETNFEDGFGSPGWLMQEFPDVYVADELRDSNGDKVPGTNRLTTYTTTTHVAYQETDVRNRASGVKVAARITIVLPTAEP